MRQDTIYEVLIAGPSDTDSLRGRIAEVISRWNVAHSRFRRMHLEPVDWLTHSRAASGAEAQELLNIQLAEHADLLIGIFASRLGTPTSRAQSGTTEEIELVRRNGKQVMLYFPARLPAGVEGERLCEYMRALPQTLYRQYRDELDLTNQLTVQLAQVANELHEQGSEESSSDELTRLEIKFASSTNPTQLGNYVAELAEHLDSRATSHVLAYSSDLKIKFADLLSRATRLSHKKIDLSDFKDHANHLLSETRELFAKLNAIEKNLGKLQLRLLPDLLAKFERDNDKSAWNELEIQCECTSCQEYRGLMRKVHDFQDNDLKALANTLSQFQLEWTTERRTAPDVNRLRGIVGGLCTEILTVSRRFRDQGDSESADALGRIYAALHYYAKLNNLEFKMLGDEGTVAFLATVDQSQLKLKRVANQSGLFQVQGRGA